MPSSELPPRRRAKAMAAGRGSGMRLVVPLAVRAAARISARPLERFLVDPTQLANGLKELRDATLADGVFVCAADGMEREALGGGPGDLARLLGGARVQAAIEATRRLRVTVADGAVLAAGLTGPARLADEAGLTVEEAGALGAQLARQLCEAGADVVVLIERPVEEAERARWHEALRTIANIVRFYRGLPYLLGALATAEPGLPAAASTIGFGSPAPGGAGLCTTPSELPDDVDIARLRDWVRIVAHRE